METMTSETLSELEALIDRVAEIGARYGVEISIDSGRAHVTGGGEVLLSLGAAPVSDDRGKWHQYAHGDRPWMRHIQIGRVTAIEQRPAESMRLEVVPA